MKKLIALGLVAVSLGGCDKLPFGQPASPQRKPGLWEQTVQADQNPAPVVTEACYDAASDKRTPIVPRPPRRAGACDKFAVSKDGDNYVVDRDCSFGGAAGGPKMTSHAVISGDFSTKYTVVSSITVQGSSDPARNGQHKLTITAVYKGDCPADIGPGQVKLPNGDVVDMAQLRRGGGGFGGGGGPGGGGGAPAGGGNAAAGGGASPGGGAPAGGGGSPGGGSGGPGGSQ